MKKWISFLALFCLPFAPIHALTEEELTDQRTTRSGIGSADAVTTAISTSMIGWGLGLTAAIAILTILVPPDEEGTSHTHSSS